MNFALQTSFLSLFRPAGYGVFGVLLALVALTPARAQTVVSITNNSFEQPPLPGPAEYGNNAPGWTVLNAPSGAGVFSTAINNTTPPAADGVQMAFANSGVGLVQVSSTVMIQPNVQYTLSGFIGHRGNDDNLTATKGAILIGAYDSLTGIFYEAAGLRATVLSTDPTFNFVSGSFVITNPDFYVDHLAIAVVNEGNSLALFDNLQLTATAIPEPAAYVAWAGVVVLGATMMWRRRRLPAA